MAERGQSADKHRRVIVWFFATGSEVEWTEGASSQRIAPGQAMLFAPDQPAKIVAITSLPPWVDGSDLTNIELRAAQELRRSLTPDRPLTLALLEKTEFRQAEVRSLACRCLCGLDIFDPIVEALNDEGQHSYWRAHFDELRLALARGAEPSAKLLAAFQMLDAGDAERIFRLLWGYTAAQLEAGGDKELVDFLEHPSMVARVLAFENLRRITGKTLLFRPEQPPDKKKSRVQDWRTSLDAGEIRYRPASGDSAPPPRTGP